MVLKGPSNCSKHAVGPKGEVSGDELESSRQGSRLEGLRWRMEVIFMADQIPEERQWALILVAGGDEAYNRWDTLEDTVQNRKKGDQVWMAFEKSFEQSTSFWHFRDTYLADFSRTSRRQRLTWIFTSSRLSGVPMAKGVEEGRMIDLLYHATIYYEIPKFVQESDPTHSRTRWSLKRQRPMSVTSLSTKTIKPPTGEQTVRLPTIIHCYPLTHCLKDGPVAAVIMANVVANVASPMSGATVLRMAKLAIGAKASIISKLSVIQRLQPRRDRAHTEASSHSCLDVVPQGATMAMAKEVAKRRRHQRSRRSRMRMQ